MDLKIRSLKNLYRFIRDNKNKVQIDFSKLGICALAGRVCYSEKVDFDDRRLNSEIISYLNRLSKWTHYSVFSHLPVEVNVAPDEYIEFEFYNLFKQIYDKDNHLLYLNLRHVLESFNCFNGKGTIEEVLNFFDGDNPKPVKDLIVNKSDDGNYYYFKPTDYYEVYLINDVDRALTHQLVRHQSLNFNQMSQRYVKHKSLKIPHSRMVIMKEYFEKNNAYWIFDFYKKSVQSAFENYKMLLDSNLPAEKARGVLPNDTPTNILVSGFVYDFDVYFKSRTSPQAQAEIRYVSNRMLELRKINKEGV